MSDQEEMTLDERWKYLRMMKRRYDQVTREERSALLDEMEQVTGLHRKSLIRRLGGPLTRRPRKGKRGRTYGPAVDDALRVIGESFDYICAERLTGNLVWMAEHLARHGELRPTPGLQEQLERVSVSTVRRILARIRQDEPRLPRKGPERANRVAKGIPMERIPWDTQEPGHFEVDLVHHSGPITSGDYVHTLQMVDVATGWSERVAVLGRSQLVMEDGFRRILARLPFPVLEIHPDNGSESFNHHLVRFWKEVVTGVRLSRSRPFHKNDNRFVEQKNDTRVRAYLGHDRLDTVAQTQALNHLYDLMWLYYNLFQPLLRLSKKIIRPTKNGDSRVKRHHGPAHTPLHRLLATHTLTPAQQQSLLTLRDQINPRHLRREVYQALDHLFSLPNAVPGQTEDVHLTLMATSNPQKGGGSPVTLSFDRTIACR